MLNTFRLQSKLFVYYSLVVSVIIISALIFFYYYLSQNLEQSAKDNLDQLALKTTQQLDSFLSELDHLALQTVTNQTVQNAFKDARQLQNKEKSNYFVKHLDVGRDVMDVLASIDGPNLTAIRLSLFNENGDYVSYGSSLEDPYTVSARMASVGYESWYRSWLAYQGNRIILPPHDDFWSEQKDVKLISLIREIRDVYESYGMLEIQQPYSKLETILQLTTLPHVKVYVYTPSYDFIYGEGNKEQIQLLINNSGKSNSKLKNEIAAYHKSTYSGWTVLLIEQTDHLLSPILILRKTLLFIGLALLMVTLLIIYLITRQLTKPLKQLTYSIQKVTLNNLSVDINNDHNSNEIVQLNRAFDKMFERLKYSMDQVVESRAHELKAQFKALQSQMNPHFLYNVLSVISAAGQEAGVMKIMEMCHKLSTMLRYITTFQEKEVTIQDELSYAKLYLELMKERFEAHFIYLLEVQEESLAIAVPKLVLQPLIENCFQHAFVTVAPPWHVNVAIGCDERCWYMQVRDSGSGFDPRILADVMNKAEQSFENLSTGVQDLKLGGLGLHHTLVRLKLLYGDEMIFKVEANEPRGTILTIGGLKNDPSYGS